MQRKLLIAAGLFCLGTSPAFAFTLPPMAPDMTKAVKQVWADQLKAEQAAATINAGETWMGPAKSAGLTVEKASFDLAKSDDLDAKAGPSEPIMKPEPKPATADATLAGELGGRSTAAQYTGMGGPLEEVDYPPCSRTVTDRCIQLYERGVRR